MSGAIDFISLSGFYDAIRSPSEKMIAILEQIQNETDKTKKAKLKESLYSFTPCVHVKDKRRYTDIIRFTGIAVLDFDKIDNPYEFKEFLFNTYISIMACWISPSKKGVKAFVKIPVVNNVSQFKKYFYGIADEMEKYNGFDGTSQNAVLPLFIGYDKDILIRSDYIAWSIKGNKLNSFDSTPTIDTKDINPTSKQSEWVINWYKDKINSINIDGHPQVRDNSLSLGGYVGGGYLSQIEAESLAENLISQNSYLKKGTNGYIKTAKEFIRNGMNKPLKFKEY